MVPCGMVFASTSRAAASSRPLSASITVTDADVEQPHLAAQQEAAAVVMALNGGRGGGGGGGSGGGGGGAGSGGGGGHG